MSHELICTWLELPAESWPPDHYRLLGLEPGEPDLALIEQRVDQRLDTVRRYQMMHPEQATEVMNRLAQAFICLTEPTAKRLYDEQLRGPRPRAVPPPLPPMVPPPLPPAILPTIPSVEPLPGAPRDPFAWLGTPVANGPGGALPVPVPVPKPAPAPPVEVPKTDPAKEAAQSLPTRRGLTTRRGLYERVLQTRNLQRLWHRLGKYLEDTERKFTNTDTRELYKLIEEVESAADDFPLIGDPGQPGHYILTLNQFDRSQTLRNLTQGQRELLRTDWQSGLTFLESHRDFLRDEVATIRRRGAVAQFRHALNTAFRDYPMVAYLVLCGAFALSIALMRTWF